MLRETTIAKRESGGDADAGEHEPARHDRSRDAARGSRRARGGCRTRVAAAPRRTQSRRRRRSSRAPAPRPRTTPTSVMFIQRWLSDRVDPFIHRPHVVDRLLGIDLVNGLDDRRRVSAATLPLGARPPAPCGPAARCSIVPVDLRARVDIDAVVLDVPDHADDLDPGGCGLHQLRRDAEALADGALARPHQSGDALIDDAHRRRRRGVARVEDRALQQAECPSP